MEINFSDLFKDSIDQTVLLGMIHHLWKDHPLKIETDVKLLALTENLVIDLSDISSIQLDYKGDYIISRKSPYQDSIIVDEGTPEFAALQKVIRALLKIDQQEGNK